MAQFFLFMYLFVVYLTILLVTHIVKRRKIQLLLQSGLEMFYKEVVVVWFDDSQHVS
jgi:hypothetical protein